MLQKDKVFTDLLQTDLAALLKLYNKELNLSEKVQQFEQIGTIDPLDPSEALFMRKANNLKNAQFGEHRENFTKAKIL